MSTKQSRATIAESVSRWISKIPNLLIIIERLRSVQISNYDFRIMFEKCDSERTLFYCDPPYPHNVRCNNNEYENEMKEADHIDLLELANNVKGKIAISGYENNLYSSYLKNFYKTIAKKKRNTLFHSSRQEVLWTNYDPFHINRNLFTK